MAALKSRDNTKELVDFILNKIELKRPITGEERAYIRSIIRKFFIYAILATIHGYVIRKTLKGKETKFLFEFRYIKVKRIPDYAVKRIKYSPKAFGYLFFLNIFIRPMEINKFMLNLDPKLMKLAKDITRSDLVYDLINPKK